MPSYSESNILGVELPMYGVVFCGEKILVNYRRGNRFIHVWSHMAGGWTMSEFGRATRVTRLCAVCDVTLKLGKTRETDPNHGLCVTLSLL